MIRSTSMLRNDQRQEWSPLYETTAETVLVMNDTQIPYHDPAALDVVEQVMQDIEPDLIVYLGDIFDFPGLSSKFRRFPQQRYRLLEEVRVGRAMFRRHRGIAPDARMVYVEGNHELRLRNYVVDNADELAALVEESGQITVPKLANLDEFNIEYVGPYGAAFEHHSFLFKHGERITTYAAAAELQVEGTSGMSGHTHKGGSAFRTNRSGAHAWYENFCLCYVDGPNRPPSSNVQLGPVNWQQGMSIIYFAGGIFNVVPIPITKGKCIVNGRLYEARA